MKQHKRSLEVGEDKSEINPNYHSLLTSRLILCCFFQWSTMTSHVSNSVQLLQVSNYCNSSKCAIVDLDLSEFPSHVSDESIHAFRPIIIQVNYTFSCYIVCVCYTFFKLSIYRLGKSSYLIIKVKQAAFKVVKLLKVKSGLLLFFKQAEMLGLLKIPL